MWVDVCGADWGPLESASATEPVCRPDGPRILLGPHSKEHTGGIGNHGIGGESWLVGWSVEKDGEGVDRLNAPLGLNVRCGLDILFSLV